MYFKIINVGEEKYTKMGMINIDAELYLEPGDEGYEKYIKEHYVTVSIIPESGYSREKELRAALEEDAAYRKQQELIDTFPEEIIIIDGEEVISPILPEGFVELPKPILNYEKEMNDYNKWIKSLPTVKQLNPFCTHSIQFEHDVTEEEILWCFEWALGITHWNYLMDDLHCQEKDENGNPYGQVVNQPIHYLSRKAFYEGTVLIPEDNRSDYMKSEMNKVVRVKQRLQTLKDVDFSNLNTIGKYKVK